MVCSAFLSNHWLDTAHSRAVAVNGGHLFRFRPIR
jgi:hypothetical protein